jgi:hypothetical protein
MIDERGAFDGMSIGRGDRNKVESKVIPVTGLGGL